MKKINIGKDDSLADALEALNGAGEDEIILVIPRQAKLREAISNFHILKREAQNAGKKLAIESVDEEILALADAAKIEAVHPLFTGSNARSLSDIRVSESRPAEPKKTKGRKTTKKISLRVPVNVEAEEEPEEEAEAEEPETEITEYVAAEEVTIEPATETPAAEAPAAADMNRFFQDKDPSEWPEDRPPRRWPKWLLGALGLVLLALLGVWATGHFFGRADVTLNLQTVPWEYEGQFTATRAAAESDEQNRIIPGELFKDERNLTQLYPASGKAEVSQKATGKITIYNAYSSSPQTLVATTRFITPDGKIFRLDAQVKVPGAEIKDGNIIPASIIAEVSADKAGPEYNTGPVTRLAIPGFKGTPKYEKFYGELKDGAAEGFIGERAVPSEADITAAKDKTQQALETSLQNNLLTRRPKDFKLIDGAAKTDVTKLTVNKNTDGNGNFSVFGEASFQGIGFREGDLKNMLTSMAQKDQPGYAFRDLNLEYSGAQATLTTGELKFQLAAKGKLAGNFSEADFQNRVAGLAAADARAEILKISGLSDGKITLWPFWLSRLPADPKHIRLTVSYQ